MMNLNLELATGEKITINSKGQKSSFAEQFLVEVFIQLKAQKSYEESVELFIEYLDYLLALIFQAGLSFDSNIPSRFFNLCNKCLYCGSKIKQDSEQGFIKHYFCSTGDKDNFYRDKKLSKRSNVTIGIASKLRNCIDNKHQELLLRKVALAVVNCVIIKKGIQAEVQKTKPISDSLFYRFSQLLTDSKKLETYFEMYLNTVNQKKEKVDISYFAREYLAECAHDEAKIHANVKFLLKSAPFVELVADFISKTVKNALVKEEPESLNELLISRNLVKKYT